MVLRNRLQLLVGFAGAFCWASITHGWQDVSIRSEDAATLLNEIRVTLVSATELSKDEHAWMLSELVDLFIANNQFDQAIECATKSNDRGRERKFNRILNARVEKAVEEFESTELTNVQKSSLIEDVSHLAANCNHYLVFSSDKEVDKLISILGLDSSFDLVISIPPALQSTSVQDPAVVSKSGKINYLARIGSQFLNNNQDIKLEEVIELLNDEDARNKFRLQIIENFLASRFENTSAAKRLAESINEPKSRYWAAFRLGIYFCGQGNLEEAAKQAAEIEKILVDVDARSQPFFADLLIWIAKLELDNGLSANKTFARAREVTKDRQRRKIISAVQALAGDTKGALSDEVMAYLAVSPLLDVENKQHEKYRPFNDVSPAVRRTAATELANGLGNPHLRAVSLCKVAEAIGSTDSGRAKEIIEEAYRIAQTSDAVAIIPPMNEHIEPSMAYEYITAGFARLGLPGKALEAAEKIAAVDSKVRTIDGTQLTKREMAVTQVMGLTKRNDQPFTEDGGREVFQAIDKLRDFDREGVDLGLESVIAKFAELGLWTEAEKALDISQEKFESRVGVPPSLGAILAQREDVQRLKHWCALCKDSRSEYLISRFCGHFIDSDVTPRLETVLAVKELSGTKANYGNILPFLVVGFWGNGNKEEALEVLHEGDIEPRGQAAADEIIRWALRNNEPELAMELIPRIKDRGFELLAYVWRAAILVDDAEKHDEFDKWIREQPVAIQVASNIGIAKRLLDEPYHTLHDGFPGN